MPSSLSDIDTIVILNQYIKYIYITILTIGIIGNFMNILLFNTLKIFRQNQSAFYLSVESIINILALVYTFVDRTIQYPDGYDLTDHSLIWCKTRVFLDEMAQLIPLSIICCTAFDQILSTSHWCTLRQMSTLKLAQRLIFIVVCLALIHSILPTFWMEIIPPIGCLVNNKILLSYFLFFYYPILVSTLPIIIASLFSLIAFRNVRRIIRRQIPIVRRRLNHQLTAMIFTRVIIFIILYLPYVVYNIFTLVKLFSSNYDIPFLVDRFMQTAVIFLKNINYAITSYIFMFSSARFRRQVKFVLKKKCIGQLRKSFCCQFNRNQVHPVLDIREISI